MLTIKSYLKSLIWNLLGKHNSTKIENGLNVIITYLPPCANAPKSVNPYIGMSGKVQDYDEVTKGFTLNTGNSLVYILRGKYKVTILN